MTKKKIIIEPDPILRKKSQKLEQVDNNLKKLMDDMLETMYAAPGIGLAAVQVGVLKRLIVIDLSKEDQKKNPIFLINPEITFQSKNLSTYEEGCLSLPGYFAEIERPAECHLTYLDYDGNQKNLKAEYTNRLNNETGSAEWADYDDQGVLFLYQQYLDQRDLSILAVGAVYLFQILDAGVESHFISFDVSVWSNFIESIFLSACI